MATSPNGQTGLDRFWKLGLGLFAWGGVVWMALRIEAFMLEIMAVFGIALLVTYILMPPVNFAEHALAKGLNRLTQRAKGPRLRDIGKSTLPRILSIVAVYVAFGLLVTLASVRLVPLVMTQLGDFSNQLPRYVTVAQDWLLDQPLASRFFHGQLSQLRRDKKIAADDAVAIKAEHRQNPHHPQTLTETEREVLREQVLGEAVSPDRVLKNRADLALSNLMTFISGTLASIVLTLTGLVLVFYFLLDGPVLKRGFINLLPEEAQPGANDILSNIHRVMYAFVKGQVLLGIVTGIYMTIVYMCFGVPYAIFLGSVFAVAEVMPIVGTWIGFTPGILVILFTMPLQIIPIAGLAYLYQAIKDNIVAPKIMGNVIGLHPVIVMVSLLVCAKVAGLVGVLFAIPLASVINVLLRRGHVEDQPQPAPKPPAKSRKRVA